MATVECRFCGRKIDKRETVWVRPFAGAERAGDNAIDTFAGVSRGLVEGGVPCCPTCLDDTPKPGHTLVIEKDGGRAAVRKMNATGAWEYVRDDISDLHTAYSTARTNLDPRCRVWFRHESQPDSAIRLCR